MVNKVADLRQDEKTRPEIVRAPREDPDEVSAQ